MKPQRIQLSRKKGWKIPANTVVVSRPSKWGNTFKVGFQGDAQACVDAFKESLTPGFAAMAKAELRGKNLACWCPLSAACHADVLLKIANSQ